MKAWSLPKITVSSIFARIYVGLLLLTLAVVVLVVGLLNVINSYRITEYRNDMANAVGYIIAEGLNRQTNSVERQYWLSDAEYILGLPLHISGANQLALTSKNKAQLAKGQALLLATDIPKQPSVGASNHPKPTSNSRGLTTPYTLYYQLADGNIVYSSFMLAQLREQQFKSLPVFVLDDLSRQKNPQQRLAQIAQHLPFSVVIADRQSWQLDDEQQARLRRREVVVTLSDNARAPAITMISPTNNPDSLLILGPIALFNKLPAELIIAMGMFGLTLLGVGIYGLIIPLHRKVTRVQQAVATVRAGNFDARIAMQGKHEIAQLSHDFDDMTDHIQRLINAQRELTRAVSHELRTPIARIRFGLEMLADSDDWEDRLNQKEAIDGDIATLDTLVDEILTYAKLEEGSPSLEWEKVALHDLIEQVKKETQNLGKPLQIQALMPYQTTAFAIADRRYLHRVLQNLAGNAVRYAKTTVIISAGVQSGQAFISVEDDGQGIAPENRDKIFIPFARLDDSRTRASGGYGLGLSIVARICYWFGGSMQVDQSPSLQGARFTMRWAAKVGAKHKGRG